MLGGLLRMRLAERHQLAQRMCGLARAEIHTVWPCQRALEVGGGAETRLAIQFRGALDGDLHMRRNRWVARVERRQRERCAGGIVAGEQLVERAAERVDIGARSEEHTSELQSHV